LDDTDAAVLASFQRYSDPTRNLEDTKEYLQDLSDEQINGVVSGVKGILHEMEFVRIEDGDPITATLFTNTNHPGFDVVLTNSESGEIREVQLKSTDNESYVQQTFWELV
jgi:hypothetical protein